MTNGTHGAHGAHGGHDKQDDKKKDEKDEKDLKDDKDAKVEKGDVSRKLVKSSAQMTQEATDLVQEAHRIFVTHINKLGGVGGQGGVLADDIARWLLHYDEKGLEPLGVKEERERVQKEEKDLEAAQKKTHDKEEKELEKSAKKEKDDK